MLHTTLGLTADRLALTLQVVMAMSLFGVSVSAQSATFARADYPLLGNTHIAGDFNGDGQQDLAGSGLNAASVMLNNGDGTFRPNANATRGQIAKIVHLSLNVDAQP